MTRSTCKHNILHQKTNSGHKCGTGLLCCPAFHWRRPLLCCHSRSFLETKWKSATTKNLAIWAIWAIWAILANLAHLRIRFKIVEKRTDRRLIFAFVPFLVTLSTLNNLTCVKGVLQKVDLTLRLIFIVDFMISPSRSNIFTRAPTYDSSCFL